MSAITNGRQIDDKLTDIELFQSQSSTSTASGTASVVAAAVQEPSSDPTKYNGNEQIQSEELNCHGDFDSEHFQRDQHGNKFWYSMFHQMTLKSWTTLLIVLQVIGFIIVTYQMSLYSESKKTIICPSYFVEKQIKSSKCLTVGECAAFSLGGRYTASVLDRNQVYRLLISLFIYYDRIQLFLNIFTSLMYGFMCENYYGGKKYLAIFFGAGLFGNFIGLLFRTNKVFAGASSSIYGIYGMNTVYIIEHYRYFGDDRSMQIKNFAWLVISAFMVFAMDDDADMFSLPFSYAFGLVFTFFCTQTNNPKIAIAQKFLVFLIVCCASASIYASFYVDYTFRVELEGCQS